MTSPQLQTFRNNLAANTLTDAERGALLTALDGFLGEFPQPDEISSANAFMPAIQVDWTSALFSIQGTGGAPLPPSDPITDVTGTAPLVVTAPTIDTRNVAITAATDAAAGSMSAADKAKLDGLPSTGAIVAANAAALTAVAVANLPNGQPATVLTYGALFMLTAKGALAIDGKTVLATPDAARVWQRGASLVAPTAIAQATWFINAATGNDESSGIDSAHAIATLAERLRRVGSATATYQSSVTITIQGNLPSSDPWVEAPVIDGGVAAMSVVGVPTQVGTAALTGFAARVPATATVDQLQTANGGGFWTPFVGKLVQDVTTAAWLWVTADAGGGAAKVSAPLNAATNAWVTPLAGDTVNVFSLPTINVIQSPSPAFGITFRFLNVTGFGVLTQSTFDRCTFSDFDFSTGVGDAVTLNNCDVAPGASLFGTIIMTGGQARTGSTVTFSGAGLDDASRLDGDVELYATVYVEGFHRVGAAGYFGPYADTTRQPFTTMLLALPFGVARQWGTSAFNVSRGSQVMLGQSAVSSLLLTGGYTIDGLATAAQYDAATGLTSVGVAVSPANIDAKNNLQNPVTGSRVAHFLN